MRPAVDAGGTGAGRRAYIGSFTSGGGAGITTAAVDPDSGALTALGATDALADPSYLALSPDRGLLYAVGEHPRDGLAAAFSLRDPDAPALLGTPVAVGGGAPTHLSLAGGQLLTANYNSGTVSSLPVAATDGTPGTPRHVLRHEGSGPDPERQEAPHAHAVLPDPTGRWVLTVDLGADSVRICALDPADGTLRVHAETAVPPGGGPRHLAFHPNGERAYVINELSSTITVLDWDAGTGTLRPLADRSTLPPGGGDGPNYPSEVVVAPDGRFLWAANRGHDSIAVFALDRDGVRPELTGCVPCGGHWPRDLALDPVGGRLYAANERSGDVTWFTVEPDTGLPRRAGSLAVPAASCVVFA
jgi:6-phosphogluconolactonase